MAKIIIFWLFLLGSISSLAAQADFGLLENATYNGISFQPVQELAQEGYQNYGFDDPFTEELTYYQKRITAGQIMLVSGAFGVVVSLLAGTVTNTLYGLNEVSSELNTGFLIGSAILGSISTGFLFGGFILWVISDKKYRLGLQAQLRYYNTVTKDY